MANDHLNVVKNVIDLDDPTNQSWHRISFDESKMIRGLPRDYIWHVKLLSKGADYDTFDGFVVVASNADVVWDLIVTKGHLADGEYGKEPTWRATVVGIDLTQEGPRVIESSFRAG